MIFRYIISGFAAGAITGALGSGGGLVLIPLLSLLCKVEEDVLFPCCLGVMLPLCICSAVLQSQFSMPPVRVLLPYLVGGTLGGIVSVVFRGKIPLIWLHRVFGCILLWSGLRCLFS